MRLTIIVGYGDNSVSKDGVFCSKLDLSECGLPDDFWAFQWNQEGDNTGEVEYKSPRKQNEHVAEIPQWANACIAVWQAKLDQESIAKI
jgi:hypothetical protein